MYFPFHACVCLTWFLFMCPPRINGEKDAKDILKEIAADSGRELTEGHLSEILACANDQTGCDKTLQTLLNNEIKLRGSLYELEHRCLPNSQEPPPDISQSITGAYTAWQERIIKRGNDKTVNAGNCNPFKSLQCQETISGFYKCDCVITGKTRTTPRKEKRCTARYGSPCFTNDNSKFYDPLSFMAGGTLSTNSTADPSLALCSAIDDEKPKETCTRLIYFTEPMCVNNDLTQKIQDLDTYFSGVTKLGLGETCNQAEERQLYTITDQEKMTMATRLEALGKLKDGGRSFCDTRKFLTCGVSNACECRYPTLPNQATGKCVLQLQFNRCDMKDGENNIDPNRTLVALARNNLIGVYKDIVKLCPSEKMSCSSGRFGNNSFCNCGDPGRAGLNCNIQLADLMIPPRLSALPLDALSNGEKWRTFVELNDKATELSRKLSSEIGDPCNLEADDAVKRLGATLRLLMQMPSTNLSKADYANFTQQVVALTNKAQKVCNQKSNRQGVFERCQHQTKKCFVAENQKKDIQYMISRFDKHRTLLCGERSPERYPDDYERGGQYLSSISTLEVLLLSGTQYCALGLSRARVNDGPSRCLCDNSGRNDSSCCLKAKKDVDTLLGINVNASVNSKQGPKNWIQKAVWMSILLLTNFAYPGSVQNI